MNFENILSHIISDINLSDIQIEDIANKADFDSKVKALAVENLPKYQPKIRESFLEIILEKDQYLEKAQYNPSIKQDIINLVNKHLVNLAEDIKDVIKKIDLPEELYKSWLNEYPNATLNQVIFKSELFESNLTKVSAAIPTKTEPY